ncbi:leucyl aminopeptidase [Tribonema minus]|uniref:Leucyl aminopeptidase n=1 Tax=Tribonema minus TaxID=303371 RepID=A0A836CNG8_9STRA|nr:leucyl aminopeptidase [Tribonema minus]
MAAARVPDLGVGTLTYTPLADTAISVSGTAAEEWSGDMVVVTVFQPEDKDALAQLPPAAQALDAALGGAITALIAGEAFKGGAKASASAIVAGSARVRRVGVVGLGKAKDVKAAAYEGLGGAVAALARGAKCESAAVVLPAEAGAVEVAKVSEGVLAGLYVDGRYKTGDNAEKPLKLKQLHLLSAAGTDADVTAGARVAAGVNLARDLVNAPPNYLTPAAMADAAVAIAQEHSMECEILEEEQVRELGMGAYLGVSQGSVLPPKFIHITYRPSGDVKKKVALIGKGLTFDSGGYNIKAGAGSMIELMKFDMGGAAATLGAAKVIGALAPEGVEAHFIVAACENMISDRAMHPGDILTASNGKTIEVLNTDAEGRLTLADALVFAEKLGVDAIVDSATLTGACIVALGPDYAALYSSDETLAKDLMDASTETGDKAWRLPLPAEYVEMIKSKVADLKNIGGKGGGSITAALFLKEFVKDTPWAHIDMAGPVWSDKAGATGYGVRLLSNWVLKQSS